MSSFTQDSGSAPVGPGDFRTTHWSVVLEAGQQGSPNAPEAMAELCRTYWYPLYAYVRRRGYSAHDAEDLTQEFFARLLEKEYLEGITREGGKFRSFLLTAVKRFLREEIAHTVSSPQEVDEELRHLMVALGR